MSAEGDSGQSKQRIAIFDLDRTITRLPTYTPFLLSSLRGQPLRKLAACAATLPWLMMTGACEASMVCKEVRYPQCATSTSMPTLFISAIRR